MTDAAHILVVEDNPGDALLERKQLAGLGMTVSVVETLQEALAYVAKTPPAAVVLDLNLPDSEGLHTLEAVRDAAPHVPVVVMTGPGMDGLAAIRAGADDFVEKGSVDGAVLRRILRHAVQRKSEYERIYDGVWRDAGPLLFTDVSGRVLRANPAAQRLRGDAPWPTLPTEEGLHDLEVGGRPLRASVSVTSFHGAPARLVRLLDRSAEVALARSQSRLSALLEHLNAAAFTLDADGIVLDWAGAAAIGEVAIGGSLTAHLGSRVSIEELVRDAANGGGEAHSRRVALRDRYLDVTLRPRDDGRLDGLLQDATIAEHMRARAEETNKMQAIAQLAGGVAHDLNNLMTVVEGGLSFAMEAAPTAIREDLTSAQQATRRATRLLRRLLDFASPSTWSVEVLQLGEFFEDVAALARPLLRDSQRLTLDLQPGMHKVLASRSALERIVLNLVTNARDANATHVQIQVRSEQDAVHVSFVDDGDGMPEHVRRRAVEPFFTTKRGNDGTGLGLASVHTLVERLGGRFELTSAVGHGTTVAIRLPHSGRLAAPRATAGDGERELKGVHIVVCDDRQDVRTVMARTFRACGAHVRSTASAEEALQALQEAPAELLVSDVWMAGMRGDELAAAAKVSWPDLAVLLVTGYAPGIDLERWNVLEKPFTAAELESAARRSLRPG